MLILLSPAKTLDFETPSIAKTATQPAMLDQSQVLVDSLRDMSATRLSSLMSISPQLGALNRERFNSWQTPFTKDNARQAILAFKGDVYVGLDAESLSADDLKYAQKHVRTLSGLYGVLRPLDLIQPYRLEMGTKLKNARGKDLYAFWAERITDRLNADLKAAKTGTVLNLASAEYFKSVDTESLEAEIVSPAFLDLKNGTYKIISFYAKKARGLMTAWVVKNRVEDASGLRKFKVAGYRYSRELSEPGRPAFVRDEKP